MASGPWTRQRESPATTLDARLRAAQPSRQPPHGPRRPHASSPRCAGSARPTVGRRRARTRRHVYGRNCVGRRATGVVGDETGPVSVVSSREARCEAWRGSGVRHRGPRSASPRPTWSQTRVRRRTRDPRPEAARGGARTGAPRRPGGPGGDPPSPYREGIQQLCVCAFFHSLTRLM